MTIILIISTINIIIVLCSLIHVKTLSFINLRICTISVGEEGPKRFVTFAAKEELRDLCRTARNSNWMCSTQIALLKARLEIIRSVQYASWVTKFVILYACVIYVRVYCAVFCMWVKCVCVSVCVYRSVGNFFSQLKYDKWVRTECDKWGSPKVQQGGCSTSVIYELLTLLPCSLSDIRSYIKYGRVMIWDSQVLFVIKVCSFVSVF